MKFATIRTFLISLFIIFFYHTQAQVVWTVPAFPTKNDDVTVYFDATKGNGALAGFQGDVYAHTGVITSASMSGSDWKHVIGNWGTADARVLMTRVSQNIYSISYNITDFYGLPANEEVLKMAFVFRNVNGSIVGRDTDGSDIYTPVYPSNQGFYITLVKPSTNDVIIFEHDSLLINVAVSDTAELNIYDNEELVYSNTVDHASFYLHPSTLGGHVLRFEAMRDSIINLEKEYFVMKLNPDKIDPPDGVVSGLNYNSDSTYIFQINAPLKKYVFLLCPENNYRANTDFQLHEAEDANTFWIELPRSFFKNGKNTYQYLMNDANRVADPYSEVVLDPSNDGGIKASVMATLPPYPQGMTSGIVTAFDEEYHPYDFVVKDFKKPENTKLVIYELLIRDFLADHSYTSLMDTLDYFKRLGVNAIELMPVSEFEGNDSWGYNISFHMAVDKYYGTRYQLKQFIDAAHQRGIAVLLDVVFNHTFGQGPFAQMYWDATNSRPSSNSPYLNAIPKHPLNVGYDFNHESQFTKKWVKRILSYWITEFKFDGFRFDLAKGFTQFNSGNDLALMAHYDAGRIAILKDYATHVWSVDSTSYVILEQFSDNDEETVLSNYGMMIWGNSNYDFSQAAKGVQSNLKWIDYTARGWNDPHVVGYLESHDEERVMYRLLTEGTSQGNYDTRQLNTALKRVAAAEAIFYSIPGPKMLLEFGELGYDFSINRCTNGTINSNCRLDPKPIRWDYLQNENREHLRQVTSDLIYLKMNYPVFSTDNFYFNDGNLFVKTVQLNHPDMDALTLANFRVINSDVIPKFQHTGTWYEYFTGDSIVVTDTEKRITFGPGEYRIYTTKRIVPPGGFLSATHDLTISQIGLFPNLISDDDVIHGSLPKGKEVKSVKISDMTGRQFKTDFFQNNDGEFTLRLSGQMPAGMYALSIQTRDGSYVGKIVKQ